MSTLNLYTTILDQVINIHTHHRSEGQTNNGYYQTYPQPSIIWSFLEHNRKCFLKTVEIEELQYTASETGSLHLKTNSY